MRKSLKIILLIVTAALTGTLIYYYSIYYAPSSIRIRNEILSSEHIPQDLDQTQILFFSDIHYGNFVDDVRLKKLLNQILLADPDVVVFAGDLFDHPSLNWPEEQQIKQMNDFLSQIEAPLGKFAVLGDHDLENEASRDLVSNLLYQCGFEVLDNCSVRIRNHTNQSITLVGLQSELAGYPDIEKAYQNIYPDTYTLTVCHTPDTVRNLPQDLTDVMLAGHTLGGQIYLPLVGGLYRPPFGEQYYRGSHHVDQIYLDITNGTGTTDSDIRLFTPAEVVVYQLQHLEPKPTADIIETPDETLPEPQQEQQEQAQPEN